MTVYYVSMTDKFLSGWGKATKRVAKYVVKCSTLEQAKQIEKAAHTRTEMRDIKIAEVKPIWSNSTHQVTYKLYSELGGSWYE